MFFPNLTLDSCAGYRWYLPSVARACVLHVVCTDNQNISTHFFQYEHDSLIQLFIFLLPGADIQEVAHMLQNVDWVLLVCCDVDKAA